MSPQTNFVHPTAVIDEGAVIGYGTHIWHFSHVMAARIGDGCTIGQNVFVGLGVVIGNRCKIQNNVSLYAGVVLEDDVFIGPSAVFTNVRNPRAEVSRHGEFIETVVRHGASIGANATIVCGAHIGAYAMVGAGAVLTDLTIQSHVLMTGVPARPRGFVCQCGETLQLETPNPLAHFKCKACKRHYLADDHGMLQEVVK